MSIDYKKDEALIKLILIEERENRGKEDSGLNQMLLKILLRNLEIGKFINLKVCDLKLNKQSVKIL